jgi:hypothetical protein
MSLDIESQVGLTKRYSTKDKLDYVWQDAIDNIPDKIFERIVSRQIIVDPIVEISKEELEEKEQPVELDDTSVVDEIQVSKFSFKK